MHMLGMLLFALAQASKLKQHNTMPTKHRRIAVCTEDSLPRVAPARVEYTALCASLTPGGVSPGRDDMRQVRRSFVV